MNQQTRIRRQLEELELTITRLEEVKESLELDCVYTTTDASYIRNRAKLMKKYNLELYDSLLLTSGTLNNIVDAGKESIKAIEFICNLLEKDKKELKERSENG